MQTQTLTRWALFSLSNGTTTCEPIIYNINVHLCMAEIATWTISTVSRFARRKVHFVAHKIYATNDDTKEI